MFRFAVAALLALPLAAVAADPDQAGDRWAADMHRFDLVDQKNPFPKGGVVFVGESNVRRWDLNRFFPGVKPLNRGFGGARLSDVARHVDRLIVRHQPRIAVIFAGGEDVAAGRTADEIAADFETIATAVAEKSPNTKVLFLSIALGPKDWARIEAAQAANAAVAAVARKHENAEFLNVVGALLDPSGNPNRGLYDRDGHHLRDGGYLSLADAVRPYVEAENR